MGIPAFKRQQSGTVQSIMEAAYETTRPVILQALRAPVSTPARNFLRHLILGSRETYPGIPVVDAPGTTAKHPANLLRCCATAFHLG